jgi:hypothetical protein
MLEACSPSSHHFKKRLEPDKPTDQLRIGKPDPLTPFKVIPAIYCTRYAIDDKGVNESVPTRRIEADTGEYPNHVINDRQVRRRLCAHPCQHAIRSAEVAACLLSTLITEKVPSLLAKDHEFSIKNYSELDRSSHGVPHDHGT